MEEEGKKEKKQGKDKEGMKGEERYEERKKPKEEEGENKV